VRRAPPKLPEALHVRRRVPNVVDEQPRCWRCRRKLAEHATRPWAIRCERCGALTASEA